VPGEEGLRREAGEKVSSLISRGREADTFIFTAEKGATNQGREGGKKGERTRKYDKEKGEGRKTSYPKASKSPLRLRVKKTGLRDPAKDRRKERWREGKKLIISRKKGVCSTHSPSHEEKRGSADPSAGPQRKKRGRRRRERA